MKRSIRLLLVAVPVALLAGCAQLCGPVMRPAEELAPVEEPALPEYQPAAEKPSAEAPRPVQPTQAIGMPAGPRSSQAEVSLKYAQAFGAMAAETQKKEIARLGKDRSELGRLQLVLALSQPASHFRDVPRAFSLLDESFKDASLRDLAYLLKSLIAERQRYEDSLQQSAQRVKDEQKRADALQQKLEDLMALEKTMSRTQPK